MNGNLMVVLKQTANYRRRDQPLNSSFVLRLIKFSVKIEDSS